jgi:methionyl-tRNA formyltransferase
VRAVAPPYPGAFTDVQAGGLPAPLRFVVTRARLSHARFPNLQPGLQVEDNALLGVCGDGRAIVIHELLHDGRVIDAPAFAGLTNSSRHS